MKAATQTTHNRFFGNYVTATLAAMLEVAKHTGATSALANVGDPYGNFEWDYETDEGIYFAVYDRNQSAPLGLNEEVSWHIAASTQWEANEAAEELAAMLAEMDELTPQR